MNVGLMFQRQAMFQAGYDVDQDLDETIAADNASLQDARRAGVTVGLHCAGETTVEPGSLRAAMR